MDKKYISADDPVEVNIEKLINMVIEEEKKLGYDQELIEYKYTHGLCGFLARFIKGALELTVGQKVRINCIDLGHAGNYGSKVEHAYIVTFDPDDKQGDLLFKKKVYYDIFGKHTAEEVKNIDIKYYIDKELENKYNGASDATISKWLREFSQIEQKLCNQLLSADQNFGQ